MRLSRAPQAQAGHFKTLVDLDGTVYKITPGGNLTTLYSFCASAGCPDGSEPQSILIHAANENFYGTTFSGGKNGVGTVFEVNADGTLVVLHSFNRTSGANPIEAGLLEDTDGNLYGNTAAGGTGNLGTLFSLSLGFAPFVTTQTSSGQVGATTIILGNGLSGSTSVTFGGVRAAFTVNQTGTAITATVPMGATTGTVTVVTPSATLISIKPFTVTP